MKYLKEHEDFLKKHETTPRKKLTELFNTKFQTQVSSNGLKQKCTKLGLVCPNGGRFKKGNLPANTKRAGTISTRKDKNGSLYMHIKISEPNKWKMLHVYIWEQKYGKIPKGYCVIFKDKNTLNTRLDNLMLVSRAELARLNQKYAYIDKSLKETALQVIKISKEIRKNLKSKENYA